MENRILLIRTGGTIDAAPYADPKKPPEYVATLKGQDSQVMPAIKELLPNRDNVDGFTWALKQEDAFVKDSKLFTENDIKQLADIIKNDERRFFVITHGTDYMTKNAAMLQKELAESGKTVAFTGSMIPLSMREQHGSDALLSLPFVIENITSQKPGVYIAGRNTHTKRLEFFSPTEVEKDWESSKADLQFTLKL